jgi:hypothetical protein
MVANVETPTRLALALGGSSTGGPDRLSAKDLSARLLAVQALAAGKLRPVVAGL